MTLKFPEHKERADVVEALQKAAKIHGINTSAKSNSFPLRPSSALKSKRELFYGLINYFKPGSIPVSPTEGRNTMLLSLGHAIEKHFVEFIERAYAIPYRNQRVTYAEIKAVNGETYTLSGELDFVIQSTVTGEMIIADSKSSADFPFKASIPKEEHLAQINLYLHSDWAKSKGISKAFIMYYNKNNSELKVYEFNYSQELAEAVINKFKEVLNTYLAGDKKGNPFARDHVFGVDWQAAYSSFKDHDNREFSVPLKDRKETSISESDIEEFDRKELTKYLGTRLDSNNIFKTEKRKLWLELGSTTLILKEEKIK